MPRYLVELSARVYATVEINADDEDHAVDLAYEEADEEVRYDPIDWDIDFIECLDEPDDVDENQGLLF